MAKKSQLTPEELHERLKAGGRKGSAVTKQRYGSEFYREIQKKAVAKRRENAQRSRETEFSTSG